LYCNEPLPSSLTCGFSRHVPKASGTTVKDTLSNCYNLVRTEMIRPPSSLDIIKKSNVLNIDLSTSDSVAAAREMGLAEKGLADVFISQLVEASTVFTSERKGRAFTILRHPGEYHKCCFVSNMNTHNFIMRNQSN
jgi:hypothetical protein